MVEGRNDKYTGDMIFEKLFKNWMEYNEKGIQEIRCYVECTECDELSRNTELMQPRL